MAESTAAAPSGGTEHPGMVAVDEHHPKLPAGGSSDALQEAPLVSTTGETAMGEAVAVIIGEENLTDGVPAGPLPFPPDEEQPPPPLRGNQEFRLGPMMSAQGSPSSLAPWITRDKVAAERPPLPSRPQSRARSWDDVLSQRRNHRPRPNLPWPPESRNGREEVVSAGGRNPGGGVCTGGKHRDVAAGGDGSQTQAETLDDQLGKRTDEAYDPRRTTAGCSGLHDDPWSGALQEEEGQVFSVNSDRRTVRSRGLLRGRMKSE